MSKIYDFGAIFSYEVTGYVEADSLKEAIEKIAYGKADVETMRFYDCIERPDVEECLEDNEINLGLERRG